MATIEELFDSQDAGTGVSNASVEIKYLIKEASAFSDAITILVATAPASQVINGETILLQSIGTSPLGCDNWSAEANYSREAGPREKTAGESYFNFEVGTENQHITHSLSTPHTLGTAPAQDGAIRVSGSGAAKKIEGTDIPFPVSSFSETHYLASGTVTTAYKKIVAGLTTQTNAAIFRDYAIGEVLFAGATGTQRGNDVWEVTYKFLVKNNEAAFGVTGVAGTVAKEGWEFAWVLSRKETSAGAGIIMNSVGAYIEQIFESGDFTTLGI